MLKKKLQAVLQGKQPPAAPRVTPERIAAANDMRAQVADRLRLPFAAHITTAFPFNKKHGAVLRQLRTSAPRLQDSNLASHDAERALRERRDPVAAAWIAMLAGPQHGAVARNQLLQWLAAHGRRADMRLWHRQTRRWRFADSDRTLLILADAKSAAEAREQYKDTKVSNKQALGNKLLRQLVQPLGSVENKAEEEQKAAETWAFFRMLPKDVVTFQTLFAGMFRSRALRKYLGEAWQLAQNQSQAGNMQIDEKLSETYTKLKAWHAGNGAEIDLEGEIEKEETEVGEKKEKTKKETQKTRR